MGKSSRGTRVGMSACRAGRSNAPKAEESAASAKIGHTALRPLTASRPSSVAQAAMPICEASITLRRSNESATMPLRSEKPMMGMTRTSPTMPSAMGLPVTSYTCHRMAAFCIIVPVTEMIIPSQSKR